jgi:hypothetical protein
MKKYTDNQDYSELMSSGEQPRVSSPNKITKYRKQFIARALFRQEHMPRKSQ